MKIEEEIKQTRFRNAHQKAVINLLFTSHWLENKHSDFFKAFGITGSQFNILRILRGSHPEKISAAEIKSRILDKNSDVSRLLDRLATKKLIHKTQCPDDKRATDITITKEGMTLLKKIDDEMDRTDSKVLRLTAAEAKQLSDLLDKSRG